MTPPPPPARKAALLGVRPSQMTTIGLARQQQRQSTTPAHSSVMQPHTDETQPTSDAVSDWQRSEMLPTQAAMTVQ